MGSGQPTISKSIFDAQCGCIWAQSNPLRGAIFRFTLPLTAAEPDV
jgi:signal transduction histidine kinase